LRITFRYVLVLATATGGLLGAADEAGFSQLVREIGSRVEAERAMKTMRDVWETDRWFTFPKFRETAENLQSALETAGLRHVELLEAPADGVTAGLGRE
jgi:hypothetical protein